LRDLETCVMGLGAQRPVADLCFQSQGRVLMDEADRGLQVPTF
jgi:hypothetical protein